MGYRLIGVIPMAITITVEHGKGPAYPIVWLAKSRHSRAEYNAKNNLYFTMYHSGEMPPHYPVPAIPIEVTFAYEPDDGENGEVHYVSTFDCIRDWAVMYWPNEEPEYCYTKDETEF